MCAWMIKLGSQVYLGNLGLNVFVRIVASLVFWFGLDSKWLDVYVFV